MNYEEITTYETVCAVLGTTPETLPDVSKLPAEDQQGVIDSYKFKNVVKAVNEGWIADFKKPDVKIQVWLKPNEEGDGFAAVDCNQWNTITSVPSCLCFRDTGRMYHVVKHFPELMYSVYFK